MAIIDTPDGDTNTLRLSQASSVDALEVVVLLGNFGSSAGQGHANIQLGDGDIKTSGSKRVEGPGEGRNGAVADDQVSLGTNTVDGDTSVLELVGKGNKVGELSAGIVKVVVVDVQLARRVNPGSDAEGERNELLAEKAIEYRVTVGTVILENFVDNIPVEDLTLPSAHDGVDVVLHDSGEGGPVIDVLNPRGQLGVPNKGVTTNKLAVLLSPVDEVVTTSQAEAAAGSFSRLPLHAVLRGKNTELISHNLGNLADTQSVLVTSGTVITATLSPDLCVKTARTSACGRVGATATRLSRSRGVGGGADDGGSCRGSSRLRGRSGLGVGDLGAGNALGVVRIIRYTTATRRAGSSTVMVNTTTLSPDWNLSGSQRGTGKENSSFETHDDGWIKRL